MLATLYIIKITHFVLKYLVNNLLIRSRYLYSTSPSVVAYIIYILRIDFQYSVWLMHVSNALTICLQ